MLEIKIQSNNFNFPQILSNVFIFKYLKFILKIYTSENFTFALRILLKMKVDNIK